MESPTKYCWVILSGDRERGDLYWSGFDREQRDHIFSRDKNDAVKFATEKDAHRAGVGPTKGIRVKQIEY